MIVILLPGQDRPDLEERGALCFNDINELEGRQPHKISGLHVLRSEAFEKSRQPDVQLACRENTKSVMKLAGPKWKEASDSAEWA